MGVGVSVGVGVLQELEIFCEFSVIKYYPVHVQMDTFSCMSVQPSVFS